MLPLSMYVWGGIGLSFFIIGLYMLLANEKSIEKFVRLNNEYRGIKTKITSKTFDFVRLIGVVFFLIGLLLIVFGWWQSTLPVIAPLL